MTLTLIVRSVDGESGGPPEFRMEGDNAVIGRSASCDWTLPDPVNHISSRHCEIRRVDGGGYVLKDISTNGTFLNGAKGRMAGEHPIADGDQLRIGRYEIVARIAVEEETPAAEAAPLPAASPAPEPAQTLYQPASDIGGATAEAAPAPQQNPLWDQVTNANSIDWERGGFGTASGAVDDSAPLAGADQLAAAFLTAVGIQHDKVTATGAEAIVKGGSLLRRLVAGLVIMVEARARAKAQMGAETTQLQLAGNNPIKFARTPEAALVQLVNPTQKGFLDAERAVEDAFVDLQSHQVATMAAIPGALRQTLERFSPGAVKRRAANIGLLARIIPAARDAALWANYEREFGTVASQSDEAFMEVFSREFRRAYARQLAKERP